MSLPSWHKEAIARPHDRKAFDSGDAEMNTFLQRFARQGHEQNAVKTFYVVADDAPTREFSVYSLAPASVKHDTEPVAMTRGMARHDVPGFRLARLAVDNRLQAGGSAAN